MRALVTISNSYMSECEMPNICLLSQIAKYLTYLFKVMLFMVIRVVRYINIQVFGVCKENDVIGFPVEDGGNSKDQVTHFHCKMFPTVFYVIHIGCVAIY